MTAAALIVDAVVLWGAIGALVAVAFLLVGVDRIDPDARGAYLFRPLLVPGVMLLWPLVLWRWWVLETGRDRWPARHAPPRRAHAPAWRLLAVLIPALLIAALLLRQTWPVSFVPLPLDATAESVR